MAKKTAQESLGRLRTGIARDTPASRATAGPEAVSGAQQESTDKATAEPGARKQAAERKVRVSVDLPRAEHKYLRDFAYDSESDAMSVMRALLQEMTEDEALAVRVQRRLAGSR